MTSDRSFETVVEKHVGLNRITPGRSDPGDAPLVMLTNPLASRVGQPPVVESRNSMQIATLESAQSRGPLDSNWKVSGAVG
jgi:hypothetical protein